MFQSLRNKLEKRMIEWTAAFEDKLWVPLTHDHDQHNLQALWPTNVIAGKIYDHALPDKERIAEKLWKKMIDDPDDPDRYVIWTLDRPEATIKSVEIVVFTNGNRWRWVMRRNKVFKTEYLLLNIGEGFNPFNPRQDYVTYTKTLHTKSK